LLGRLRPPKSSLQLKRRIVSRKDQIRLAILPGLISGVYLRHHEVWLGSPFSAAPALPGCHEPSTTDTAATGFSSDFTHIAHLYNGNPGRSLALSCTLGLPIFFTVLYCVIAEFKPGITLWQGSAYGYFSGLRSTWFCSRSPERSPPPGINRWRSISENHRAYVLFLGCRTRPS
jgi:hypothetical protein